MLFHPAVIALLAASFLVGMMLLYSSYYGYEIVRRWDLTSGSELQLTLERRTYLISTILSYAFGFQVLSLFLYVFTAENMHTLFVGAMCAAGTLNVNGFGYPTLMLKIVNFMLAGTWLIINYVDNRAYDYPLVRKKYLLLLFITPVVLAETVSLANYFLRLDPDIITSCCGSLFSVGADSISSDIVSLPAKPTGIALYLFMAAAIATGLHFRVRAKGSYLFSALGAVAFVVGTLALISFVSPYVYELPTHRCPFCLLQAEYGFIGYPMYVALLVGGVTAISTGVIAPFRRVASLAEIIPRVQKKLAVLSAICFLAFVLLVSYSILFSNLVQTPGSALSDLGRFGS